MKNLAYLVNWATLRILVRRHHAEAEGVTRLCLADTILTEAAPVFAVFEGRGFGLRKSMFIRHRQRARFGLGFDRAPTESLLRLWLSPLRHI